MATERSKATTLLTVRDVARRLSISRSCVYQLIESGKLPYHRLGPSGGVIRVSDEDLDQYVASCRAERETGEQTRRKSARPKLKHIRL